MTKRFIVLPPSGQLLISTDVHGNKQDITKLCHVFETLVKQGHTPYWVILGDSVHGPNEVARKTHPDLYGYTDESFRVVEEIDRMKQKYPGQVFYVLGNHDYGHIGGSRTAKFYRDEVAELESHLTVDQLSTLRRFFQESLLAVVAPCGAFLCHGSPDSTLNQLEDLDEITLPPSGEKSGYHTEILRGFLWMYGQPKAETDELLNILSRSPTLNQNKITVTFVVHGHDRDEKGYFIEGGNQLCPVLFGALKEMKCYVLLDLAATYHHVNQLREGVEIKRLYGW